MSSTLADPRTEELLLGDGSRLSDCFDDVGRRLAAKVFADPVLHRVEMARVFARTWNFVGFEEEIRNPGDFVVRYIGSDSVIVSRDASGKPSVMLNSCTHRGTQLAEADRGHCERFKCPYHGWVFDCGGRLQGMSAERERLGPDGRRDAFDLRQARLASYAGLLFATWDAEAPDFETYLGDARFYFDIVVNAADRPLVPLGPPQRWTIDADWKLGAENFAGDAYHAPFTHSSVSDVGVLPALMLNAVLGATSVADPRFGHALLLFNLPRMMGVEEMPPTALGPMLFPWLPPDVLPEVQHRLNRDQLAILDRGEQPGVGNLFPNFAWVMQPTPLGPLCSFRTWNPAGPGRFELWSWAVVHPDADENLRAATARAHCRQFGFSGVIEQDDTTIWSRIQRARQGAMGGEQFVDYSARRPPSKENYFPDGGTFPGPGTVWLGKGASAAADDSIWQFYVRWRELMVHS
ncbi:MAG: hypothetical protein QOI86_3800 [Actinomycetota bacterium]|nr:hypothetical protein [Actinomycetota bacterium]